ncbi:uncharacterized protein LOC130654935 [Hydractinia symbiolongicarpus]|uniref:uncharacterized protein LOC130654935 n=1 Tax=Hydractinia symbiolongicarpus TaxID=13093 RepID=UPI00254F8317|nr:uncharacterized protein LOC130654935 [Hydractinia symbiolongicarpus]
MELISPINSEYFSMFDEVTINNQFKRNCHAFQQKDKSNDSGFASLSSEELQTGNFRPMFNKSMNVEANNPANGHQHKLLDQNNNLKDRTANSKTITITNNEVSPIVASKFISTAGTVVVPVIDYNQNKKKRKLDSTKTIKPELLPKKSEIFFYPTASVNFPSVPNNIPMQQKQTYAIRTSPLDHYQQANLSLPYYNHQCYKQSVSPICNYQEQQKTEFYCKQNIVKLNQTYNTNSLNIQAVDPSKFDLYDGTYNDSEEEQDNFKMEHIQSVQPICSNHPLILTNQTRYKLNLQPVITHGSFKPTNVIHHPATNINSSYSQQLFPPVSDPMLFLETHSSDKKNNTNLNSFVNTKLIESNNSYNCAANQTWQKSEVIFQPPNSIPMANKPGPCDKTEVSQTVTLPTVNSDAFFLRKSHNKVLPEKYLHFAENILKRNVDSAASPPSCLFETKKSDSNFNYIANTIPCDIITSKNHILKSPPKTAKSVSVNLSVNTKIANNANNFSSKNILKTALPDTQCGKAISNKENRKRKKKDSGNRPSKSKVPCAITPSYLCHGKNQGMVGLWKEQSTKVVPRTWIHEEENMNLKDDVFLDDSSCLRCGICCIAEESQTCIHIERRRIMIPNPKSKHVMSLRKRNSDVFYADIDKFAEGGDSLKPKIDCNNNEQEACGTGPSMPELTSTTNAMETSTPKKLSSLYSSAEETFLESMSNGGITNCLSPISLPARSHCDLNSCTKKTFTQAVVDKAIEVDSSNGLTDSLKTIMAKEIQKSRQIADADKYVHTRSNILQSKTFNKKIPTVIELIEKKKFRTYWNSLLSQNNVDDIDSVDRKTTKPTVMKGIDPLFESKESRNVKRKKKIKTIVSPSFKGPKKRKVIKVPIALECSQAAFRCKKKRIKQPQRRLHPLKQHKKKKEKTGTGTGEFSSEDELPLSQVVHRLSLSPPQTRTKPETIPIPKIDIDELLQVVVISQPPEMFTVQCQQEEFNTSTQRSKEVGHELTSETKTIDNNSMHINDNEENVSKYRVYSVKNEEIFVAEEELVPITLDFGE